MTDAAKPPTLPEIISDMRLLADSHLHLNGEASRDLLTQLADKLEYCTPPAGWIKRSNELPLGKGAVAVAVRTSNGDGDGSWHYERDEAVFDTDGWYNASGVGRYRNALRIDYWHELPSVNALAAPENDDEQS